MGEVYRGRDTELHRDVALKVLSERFAEDPDRLARFKREAQVLASLNHPHIGAIYGVADFPGGRALVLELVEGPTLADRIALGPIPLEEALPIARQIAEALAAAHELGIVHRDLKPANVKLRPDGAVKVLDFGLAKALGKDWGQVYIIYYGGQTRSGTDARITWARLVLELPTSPKDAPHPGPLPPGEGAEGSMRMAAVPPPGRFWRRSEPPWAARISVQRGSPSPLPDCLQGSSGVGAE